MQRQIRYFEMQCERNPRSRHFLALADLQRRSGEPELALEILNEGLLRCPKSISARFLLGTCCLEMGETDAAIGHFEQVLSLDPAHGSATAALEAIAASPDKGADDVPDVADEVAKPADPDDDGSATDPDPGDAVDPVQAEPATLSDSESEAEDTETAPPVAEPVIAVQDTRQDDAIPSMFVTRTLADIYLSQGHKDKALRILYQILAAHPEREDIVARISELEQQAGPGGSKRPGDDDTSGPDGKDDNRKRFDQWVDKTRGEK